jgi:phosphoribosylformylglycinamidine (FGAM) synthase-like enzyme
VEVTVAHRVEIAFAGGLGMDLDLRDVPQTGLSRNDFLLFSESQSRFVVTIDPAKNKTFESHMKGVIYGESGVVTESETLRIIGLQGEKIIEANIYDMKEAWQKPLRF